jgi:hypothetical protein
MRENLRFTFTGLMLVLMAASPVRAATPIDGVGDVGACPTRGIIKLKPALVAGGTEATTIKVITKAPKGFEGPCPGATGDGLNVAKAKGKGEGTSATNDCGNLAGTQPNNIVLTVKWKTLPGTPKLNPSTITLTTQTGGASGNLHGTFDVAGTVTAGSFLGNNVTASLETDQALSEVGAACQGKGLKKITFGIKASKADDVIGSGTVTIN